MSNWLSTDYKKALTAHGRLLPLVERTLLRENLASQEKRDKEHLHPSEICKKDWCPRASFYKLSGIPETEESMPFSRLNIFAEGNAIHDKWQRWLADAGVLHGVWKCNVCESTRYGSPEPVCFSCGADHPGWRRYREVPIHNEEHMVIGHSDGHIVDKKGEALLEIKSIGVGTLRFDAPEISYALGKGTINLEGAWSAIKYPFPSHLMQGYLYMFFTGIHTIVFIYECKWNQQVKEFTIHFNHDKIAPVLSGCLEVKRSLERGKQPPRPIWAEDSSSPGCKKCSYKEVCWKETQHENRSIKPSTSGGGACFDGVQQVVHPPEQTIFLGTRDTQVPRRVVRR